MQNWWNKIRISVFSDKLHSCGGDIFQQPFSFAPTRSIRQVFRPDMAKPVLQFIALAHQKIAEKPFKEFGSENAATSFKLFV